jgi:hypothetical protein
MPYLGRLGGTSHVPALPTGPTFWSSTHWDGLCSCVTALTLQAVQLPSVAAVPCPGMDCRPVTMGSHNTSDLVRSTCCQSSMISACRYHLFSFHRCCFLDQTLLVMQVCLLTRGLNQQGQQPLTDTAGPPLPEACRLRPMTWHHDHKRSCQATGNNNPGTSFSAITKKLTSLPAA